VRWTAGIEPARRTALEERFDLRNGEPDRQSPSTWQYELGNRSRRNIEALVRDPAAEDTHNIDRDRMTAARPSIAVGVRPLSLPPLPFPFSEGPEFRDPLALFQPQSACLILAGCVLLWAARRPSKAHRRAVMIAVLVLTGTAALLLPISPLFVTMGDANQHVESRRLWEDYAGVNGVRFEAHLTYAVLGRLDDLYGRDPDAPRQAVVALTRLATVYFVLSALAVAILEGWSTNVARYLGLSLLAPSALMYFGWREFGYLALNVAVYPFVRRGLQRGTGYLEAGSALSGLGAALHGWGLVSLASAWVAAIAESIPWRDRVARALRIAAWGTAAYVGWTALYIIVLKLPVTLGHASAVPWRPWFTDTTFDGRVNAAILSADGMRILLMSAWVVGAGLLAVAASLWHRMRQEVVTAVAYSIPSLAFLLLVFHTQGLHEDMDVVFGIFPAVYALAWVCAQDSRRTTVAAVLLVSAHFAFWRIVLDGGFVSRRF
jgi:hypothetical protein